MATYDHGVKTSEIATSLIPTVKVSAGLPVVFGTAPLHLAIDPAGANMPVLCYTYAEAVQQLGYSDDWEKYTLCEMMDAAFAKFGIAPVVFVNVLDPTVHKEAVAEKEYELQDGTVVFADTALLSTLVVKTASDGEPLIKNTDYIAAYSDDEQIVITPVPGGAAKEATKLFLAYDRLEAAKVDKDDILGGIDIATGKPEGLELVSQVYPRFQLIPGQIIAPGWSDDPEVAAVMVAKTRNINMSFKAMAWTDLPTGTDGVKKYSDAAAWKTQNNYVSEMQAALWPMVRLSSKKYHLSTQMTCRACLTDSQYDDIPYKSPSNELLQANGLCLLDGSEVVLDQAMGNYLNGQGIITAINHGGWKLWGNRTAVYPNNTDPKDSFVPVRRMFNWINNTLVTTFFSKVDQPTNKRLIETIVDSANDWLNGLTAREFILGGEVTFLEMENPTTDLIDGIIRFHVKVTPPTPARSIEFILEFYPEYYNTLFEAA